MDELFIWIIAIVAVSLGVCGIVGAVIMSGRGNSPVVGFILGALFGPIGLVMALLIRPSEAHEASRQQRIESLRKQQSQRQQRIESMRQQQSQTHQRQAGKSTGRAPASGPKSMRTAKFPRDADEPLRTMLGIRERTIGFHTEYRWECRICRIVGQWRSPRWLVSVLSVLHSASGRHAFSIM